jgi:hypothetical protein
MGWLPYVMTRHDRPHQQEAVAALGFYVGFLLVLAGSFAPAAAVVSGLIFGAVVRLRANAFEALQLNLLKVLNFLAHIARVFSPAEVCAMTIAKMKSAFTSVAFRAMLRRLMSVGIIDFNLTCKIVPTPTPIIQS